MQAAPLTADDRPAWERLWTRAGSPLGLAWDWVERVATGEFRRIGIKTDEGELLAGTAFVLRRHRGINLWAHPTPSPWAGILAAPDSQGETFWREMAAALSPALAEAAWASIILRPGQLDGRGFLWANAAWKVGLHYNYINRITGPDSLLVGAEGSVRRQARKAAEAGIQFQEDHSLVPDFIALFESTRQRQGFAPILTADVLRRLADPATGGRMMAVCHAGKLLAGAVVREDPERAYYLVGASAEDGEGTGAPTLLHAEITRCLYERRGPFIWDWVGANTPSVAQFKKKFRPELEPCLKLTWRTGLGRLIGTG